MIIFCTLFGKISSQYILTLKPKIERPLPEVFETEKSKPYILGNKKKPKKAMVGRIGPVSELLFYFDSNVDTGFAFLNSFNFYLGWPLPQIPSKYRINVYQLNKATVRFYKDNHIKDFQPSFEYILYSSNLYDWGENEGWQKITINEVIPSSDFIVGIEIVHDNSIQNYSKKNSQVSIGMTNLKKGELKIPYKYLANCNISPTHNYRTTIFYPLLNSTVNPDEQFSVYCEMKNYY